MSLRLPLRRTALALVVMLAGCANTGQYRDTDVPIASIAAFDADRYAGLWYEVARFPVPFQSGCTDVTAEYTPRADGQLGVRNICLKEGRVSQIEGSARVTGPGRLSVRFDTVPFISAPYWVLWVDQDYRTAVVGVPSGRAGWILNRAPEIPQDRLNAALQVLDFNGYDISRIMMTPQAAR